MSELVGMADIETRQLWDELKLGYTETPGHPVLRQEISQAYEHIDKQGVLVMAPQEGIFLIMHALLEPGDHMICTAPAYQSLHEVARSIGCQVSTWEPHENQGWRFDIADLNRLLRVDTRLVVINFPHNPTGCVPPVEDFKSLIQLLKDRGVRLLSDEIYRYLEVEADTTLPAACDLYERAFSLSGLSKAFGLPGLRIGWLASQDHAALERVSLLKDYTTICSSAPGEILAITALRSRETIIDRQLKRVRRNVKALDVFFDSYDDIFRWNRPRGGSICFPRMLSVDDTAPFCEQLVLETGIMLVPSVMFQYDKHHVRVGFGRENLPQVLKTFGNYLDRKFK
jgi:aspartate/methionine/tyrosine aminotransferase